MTYIFDGPDRCGKTTQIQNLKNYLEDQGHLVHLFKYSKIRGPDIESRSKLYYTEIFDLINYVTNQNMNLIIDRSFASEVVYSPLYRDYSGDYIYELEEKYKHLMNKITSFICIDAPENLIERDDGWSHSIDLDKKKDEIARFIKYHENSKIKFKHLIIIAPYNIEQVWEVILNKL
jgi:thymidylate kinase